MCFKKEAAAAVEALCLLQDREEGTADPEAAGISRAPAKRSVLPESRGRAVSIVTKKLCAIEDI